ncbi:aminopeptidase P family protein [Prevotella sp. A2931]|uniref:Aminopeptidase P family protein n=1 Tax=Prevotella illustrans TaxID=2800387 RepID=A0ABS3M371_9BACT|nr:MULTISPECIES: aminopeptidase P family protein [Prevotella]MBO1362536.1 aminopeptidase P family protein [Prevotella illustrans]PTL26707.1 peptidase M24 [Prevotella sp. oral taxon 820]
MKEQIRQRLAALRSLMSREKMAAFIFPSTDAHNSEYVADHWKIREWISGFDGSAGTVVVTMNEAALWTDSRYFLAAEKQLEGTGIVLMRLKMPGTPTIAEWLGRVLADSESKEVGLDGWVNSAAEVDALTQELRKQGGLTLRVNLDPMRTLWIDRPPIPQNPVEVQPIELAGETAASKLARVREALRAQHCDGMLMSALDDIAWTLNLRGTDVHCNPVFVAYLVVEPERTTLFVQPEKLTDEVRDYLTTQGVAVRDYSDVADYLRHDYFAYNILMDENETNSYLMACMKDNRAQVVRRPSPVPQMKAVKNEAEIDGFRRAMTRDGVAMVKFLKWLRPAVEAGDVTEMTVADKLLALRREQPLFRDISFDTIAGYAAHGAIVHYEATPQTDVALKPCGFVLIDSGAQYQDGTTDITRTVALGPVTEEEKRVYTLVLKGHIQLELAKFPENVSGTQLDALAREAMWREGMNYLHGTGHGVGSYLNVHEGPHQIRMEYKPAPLRAGMTVTDEPGIYLAGRFGVRIENTLLICPYLETEFGRFLQMESLTLCPIDTVPIARELLTDEEIAWLNDYHQLVYDRLSPLLNADEQAWLREATQPLA